MFKGLSAGIICSGRLKRALILLYSGTRLFAEKDFCILVAIRCCLLKGHKANALLCIRARMPVVVDV